MWTVIFIILCLAYAAFLLFGLKLYTETYIADPFDLSDQYNTRLEKFLMWAFCWPWIWAHRAWFKLCKTVTGSKFAKWLEEEVD